MPSSIIRRRAVAAVVGIVAVAVAAIAPPAVAASVAGEGDQLYVSNGGSDSTAANIARFGIGTDGRVALAETVQASEFVSGLVFTPELGVRGLRFAYASTGDTIDRYLVEPGGALTFVDSTKTPEPFGIAISPRGPTVFVANFDDGDGKGSVSAFHVEPTGALRLVNTIDSGTVHPKGVAVTPDGRFVYVVHGTPRSPEPSVLTGFAVGADGSLSGPVTKAAIGPSGHRVVITPDGRFLYATMQEEGDAGDVFGFRIGASGELTPVSSKPFEAGVWVEGAAVSPDGLRLYVVALGTVGGPTPVADGQIRGFDIGAGGGLVEVARVDYGFDPNDLAVGLDGQHLYVADFSVNTVAVFSVSAAGAIGLLQTVSSAGDSPSYQGVTVQPRRAS
jgi:6-phosphogluconolactonase